MSVFVVIQSWFAGFAPADWAGLAFFLAGLFGYRFFLAQMLKYRPTDLFLGKLQKYRTAWIEAHSGGTDNMVVVQTLRNTIMSASFLASTAVILIMGAFNLLHTLGRAGAALEPTVEVVKILLIILLLFYTFFNFTWYIRETNYMSFILNIPKDRLDQIEDGDSTARIAQMFLTSGIYFSLGMRGYYFLVPLLLWFFSPVLMIGATGAILYILLRRDLAGG
ncbi:MAG: DUF599 domain-containing protein [Desulfobacterales bacterium]|nr:DUF599 domain-containing protein [Desulfobacterales bacterium]